MNYNITFPGHCGCNSNAGIYGTNMWNVNGHTSNSACGHQQACNGCIDIYKSQCILYTGSNLTNTGINKNDDLSTILEKLDAIKAVQDAKNTNILAALNDINDRLNTLEGGNQSPYTLL